MPKVEADDVSDLSQTSADPLTADYMDLPVAREEAAFGDPEPLRSPAPAEGARPRAASMGSTRDHDSALSRRSSRMAWDEEDNGEWNNTMLRASASVRNVDVIYARRQYVVAGVTITVTSLMMAGGAWALLAAYHASRYANVWKTLVLLVRQLMVAFTIVLPWVYARAWPTRLAVGVVAAYTVGVTPWLYAALLTEPETLQYTQTFNDTVDGTSALLNMVYLLLFGLFIIVVLPTVAVRLPIAPVEEDPRFSWVGVFVGAIFLAACVVQGLPPYGVDVVWLVSFFWLTFAFVGFVLDYYFKITTYRNPWYMMITSAMYIVGVPGIIRSFTNVMIALQGTPIASVAVLVFFKLFMGFTERLCWVMARYSYPLRHVTLIVFPIQACSDMTSEMLFSMVKPLSREFFIMAFLNAMGGFVRDSHMWFLALQKIGERFPSRIATYLAYSKNELPIMSRQVMELNKQNFMSEMTSSLVMCLVVVLDTVWGSSHPRSVVLTHRFDTPERLSLAGAYAVLILVRIIQHSVATTLLKKVIQRDYQPAWECVGWYTRLPLLAVSYSYCVVTAMYLSSVIQTAAFEGIK